VTEKPDVLESENKALKNEIKQMQKRLDAFNKRHPNETCIDEAYRKAYWTTIIKEKSGDTPFKDDEI